MTLFQRWNSTLFQRWNLTLFQRWNPQLWNDVENGYFPDADINNVVSTLKISCSTSRPKINLKTTLKQHCVPARIFCPTCGKVTIFFLILNRIIKERVVKTFLRGILSIKCHSNVVKIGCAGSHSHWENITIMSIFFIQSDCVAYN